MFGSYRRGEANDPKTYVAVITAILAEYDEEVIFRVTHSIPRTMVFMPNPAEVVRECKSIAKMVEGERLMEDRAAKGFRWLKDKNGRDGFFNELGEEYGKQRRLPAK
jgi:hypothetical protein